MIRKADQPDDRPPRRKPKDYLPDVSNLKRDPNAPDVWELMERIRAKRPPEARDDDWPTDMSKYMDHYLYGIPKDQIK